MGNRPCLLPRAMAIAQCQYYCEGLFALVDGLGVVALSRLKKGLLAGFCPFAVGDGIAAFIFAAASFWGL